MEHRIVLILPEEGCQVILHCHTCDLQLSEWFGDEVSLADVSKIALYHQQEDIRTAARELLKMVSMKDLVAMIRSLRK